jgi:hypothetical protein
MGVRFLLSVATGVFLVLASSNPLHSQDDPPPAVQPQDQLFAGIVTALSDTSVTVTRTVLGKDSTVRTFAITPDTHIEGKPKMKSKVTVRFIASDDGDRALRIIVRGVLPAPKKQ